jgi:sigma-B regulation protein RsbU (phosphoserine phosphatase)
MSEIAAVLGAFHDATRCDAAIWRGGEGLAFPVVEAATTEISPPPIEFLPTPLEPAKTWLSGGRELLVAAIPGPRPAWVALGPCGAPDFSLALHMKYLLPVAQQYLQAAVEVEHAANELAERYEEINLLYTISEILGRTLSLEEAAAIILREISETVGARRASILVHDRVTDTLQVVAAIGAAIGDIPPIALDDDCSVSAGVFRSLHPRIVEGNDQVCPAETPYRQGAMLSVPILWTTPRGGEPLGVVNLSDRRSGQPFTAGDLKLIAAIATQIGTAIQNARLVRASLDQQRLQQEMQLAHNLQMRLLPDPRVVHPDAKAAAKVVPAESVGGDFYQLFPLGSNRVGVMIGDVSGHGYQAALIMALTMSAAAFHAQTTADPGETLGALVASVEEELATTEMHISAFYAVIDARGRRLRYANAGHPHAFVLHANGAFERLPASDPPLGMMPGSPPTAEAPWDPEGDLMVLFTDGVSDARGRDGKAFGEERVLAAIGANRTKAPEEIIAAVLATLDRHTGDTPRRDDLTIVLLRS